jgi:rhodanese-related sulfurtransferase
MKDMWTWIAVALPLVAWVVLTRLGKISGAQARQLVAAGAQLVDVRTEREFASGHLPGATNVPLDGLRGSAASLATSGKPLIVYCQSGMRSAAAKRILRAAGANQVHDLGAMSRW